MVQRGEAIQTAKDCPRQQRGNRHDAAIHAEGEIASMAEQGGLQYQANEQGKGARQPRITPTRPLSSKWAEAGGTGMCMEEAMKNAAASKLMRGISSSCSRQALSARRVIATANPPSSQLPVRTSLPMWT